MIKNITLFTLAALCGATLFGMDPNNNNNNPVGQQPNQGNQTITFECSNGNVDITADISIFEQSNTLKNCLLANFGSGAIATYIPGTKEHMFQVCVLLKQLRDGQLEKVKKTLAEKDISTLLAYLILFDFLEVKECHTEILQNICLKKLNDPKNSQAIKDELRKTDSIFKTLPQLVEYSLLQSHELFKYKSFKDTLTFEGGHGLEWMDGNNMCSTAFNAQRKLLVVSNGKSFDIYKKDNDAFKHLLLNFIQQSETIIGLEISNDGNLLAIHSDNMVTLWDITDILKPISIKELPGRNVQTIKFLDDQNLLVVENNRVLLYTINTDLFRYLEQMPETGVGIITADKKSNLICILSRWILNENSRGITAQKKYLATLYPINGICNKNITEMSSLPKELETGTFLKKNIFAAIFDTELTLYDVSTLKKKPITLNAVDLATIKPDIDEIILCKGYDSTLFTLDKKGILHIWHVSNKNTVEYINSIGKQVKTFEVFDGFIALKTDKDTQIFINKITDPNLTLEQLLLQANGLETDANNNENGKEEIE